MEELNELEISFWQITKFTKFLLSAKFSSNVFYIFSIGQDIKAPFSH